MAAPTYSDVFRYNDLLIELKELMFEKYFEQGFVIWESIRNGFSTEILSTPRYNFLCLFLVSHGFQREAMAAVAKFGRGNYSLRLIDQRRYVNRLSHDDLNDMVCARRLKIDAGVSSVTVDKRQRLFAFHTRFQNLKSIEIEDPLPTEHWSSLSDLLSSYSLHDAVSHHSPTDGTRDFDNSALSDLRAALDEADFDMCEFIEREIRITWYAEAFMEHWCELDCKGCPFDRNISDLHSVLITALSIRLEEIRMEPASAVEWKVYQK